MKHLTLFTGILAIGLIFMAGCKKEEVKPAKVTTSAITNITATSATSGGTVVAGDDAITQVGVCYGINHNPTFAGTKTNDGTDEGTFTSNITGLISTTTYYVRAYANAGGKTYYGDEVSFTTESATELIMNGDFSLPDDGVKYLTMNSVTHWKTDETESNLTGREYDQNWLSGEAVAFTDLIAKSIYQVIGTVPATATNYSISLDHNFLWSDWGDYSPTVCLIFSAYSGSDPTTRTTIGDTIKFDAPALNGAWSNNWTTKTASFSIAAGSAHAGKNLVFEVDVFNHPEDWGYSNTWFQWDNISVKASSGK
jgi:hypothetical protein